MSMFKFEGIAMEEAPKEVIPKCPHCRQELRKLWTKAKGTGVTEQKLIVMCPECQCFLGFGGFAR